MKIDRSRPTPASFWTYKAPPAPDQPPPGVSATRQEWLQLTPGYRREIARQLERVAMSPRQSAAVCTNGIETGAPNSLGGGVIHVSSGLLCYEEPNKTLVFCVI